MKVAVVIAAAGAGERLGRGPKAMVEVAGRPLLGWCAATVAAWGGASLVVVASPPGMEDRFAGLTAAPGVAVQASTGGASRQASIGEALRFVPTDDWDVIVCHDAARPFATPELFAAVVEAAGSSDAALPVVPVADTVKRVKGSTVLETLDRTELMLAQTPQAFRAEVLHAAHRNAAGPVSTDDASLVERAGFEVRAIPGDAANIKITTPADLRLAEAIAAGRG